MRVPTSICNPTMWPPLLARHLDLLVAITVFGSCAYFFQGGGWNTSAHFATTVALIEDHTFSIDRYRDSTGDVAHSPVGIVSVKPAGTALASIPGYLLARTVAAGIDNAGNRRIATAYLTSVFSSGVALTLVALVLLRMLRRRLAPRDAVVVALGITLATPLFPNSTTINSTAFVALTALSAYALLEESRLKHEPPGSARLLFAGLAAGLTPAFEYQTALVILPLGLYACWQARTWRTALWFGLGLVLAAVVPLAHHSLVYGDPFHVGYASFANPGMAHSAAVGFFGFDGFSLERLYDMTFGAKRGFFLLSPFLVAAAPGLVLGLKDHETRPEALTTGAVSWGVLLMIACLSYWHSGWGLASRYAVLFVVFSAVPIALELPRHRGWMSLGLGAGLAFMVTAAAVAAAPPPEARSGRTATVVGWLWDELTLGKLPFRKDPVLLEVGVGSGNATWPSAFNGGQLLGLSGWPSLAPLAVFLSVMLGLLWVATHATVPHSTTPQTMREPAAHRSRP